MKKNLIILSVVIVVFLGIASYYLWFSHANNNSNDGSEQLGPGIQCNYVFKSPYDFGAKAIFQIDDQGKISGWGPKWQGIGAVGYLNNGYLLVKDYMCSRDFLKHSLLANVNSEDWQILDQSREDLLLKDTYSEFYYCSKNPKNTTVDKFNELIDNGQLGTFCEKIK